MKHPIAFFLWCIVIVLVNGGCSSNEKEINNASPNQGESRFTVVLKDAGAQKIQAIKAARETVPSMGLAEAKDLVESTPAKIKENVTQEEAEEIKRKFEAVGASVDIIIS